MRWLLFATMTVELIAITILERPLEFDFSHVAFCDPGANLSIQSLISHGYSPALDFGYHYGLLPILIGWIWFAITGLTPFGYELLSLACGLGIAFAFARIASALDFHPIAIVLLLLTLWFSIHPNYPSIAHASEALLLAMALSEQALERRRSALILATVAVFAKPSMGYVYGALLIVIWFARTPAKSRRSRFLPELVTPAGITAAAFAIVLSVFYGPAELVRTVFPLEGAAAYRVLNYGFFTGSGRAFWDPAHNSWTLYAFGPAGLWIAATAFLACAAFGAASRLWPGSDDSSRQTNLRDEIILTCFILHAAFVCLFFGNQWSWFYYSYFLIIGVAAAVDTGPVARRAGIAICLIGALSGFGVSHSVLHRWRTRDASAVTAWMWSQPEQATEWNDVLNLTRGHRTTILDTKGAAELMFPQFQPPVSLYLDPGLMLPSDIDRKVQQLADSDLVVVPINIATCGGIPDSPRIHVAMSSFALIFSGHYFVVYRRKQQSTRR